MGQYYKFMNIDKKQRCDQNQHMLKLLEHSYIENEYCMDILSLLSNEWKGDRVLHVGDYAEGTDGTTTCKIIEQIEDDYKLEKTVYDWQDKFEDIEPNKVNSKIRYVYNLDKKEYIDLVKQPLQWVWVEKNKLHFSKINSFALLIACGNEQGGGDYRLVNRLQVGSWAGNRFVSSDSLLEEYKNFKENNYIFNEELGISKNRRKYDERNEKVILAYEEKEFLDSLNRIRKNYDVDIDKLKIQSNYLTINEQNSFENLLEKYKILIKTHTEELIGKDVTEDQIKEIEI